MLLVLCLSRAASEGASRVLRRECHRHSCLISWRLTSSASASATKLSASMQPPSRHSSRPSLSLRKAVVLSKFSRFEYEKHRQPHMSEAVLQKLVSPHVSPSA